MSLHFHIAQANIGRLKAPLNDPSIGGFVAELDRINAAADQAPGFVWRLTSASGNATDILAFADDRILINLSVWESLGALQEYVYRGSHAAVLRRRHEWFETFDGVYVALWWIPANEQPTPDDAKARLEHLNLHGPTAHAFTFARSFPAPG